MELCILIVLKHGIRYTIGNWNSIADFCLRGVSYDRKGCNRNTEF